MKKKKIEMETHHNQTLTTGARGFRGADHEETSRQTETSEKQSPSRKKVVALQLDDREYAAYKHLGADGLKALLCPDHICISCRTNAPLKDSPWSAYCGQCLPE